MTSQETVPPPRCCSSGSSWSRRMSTSQRGFIPGKPAGKHHTFQSSFSAFDKLWTALSFSRISIQFWYTFDFEDIYCYQESGYKTTWVFICKIVTGTRFWVSCSRLNFSLFFNLKSLFPTVARIFFTDNQKTDLQCLRSIFIVNLYQQKQCKSRANETYS